MVKMANFIIPIFNFLQKIKLNPKSLTKGKKPRFLSTLNSIAKNAHKLCNRLYSDRGMVPLGTEDTEQPPGRKDQGCCLLSAGALESGTHEWSGAPLKCNHLTNVY